MSTRSDIRDFIDNLLKTTTAVTDLVPAENIHNSRFIPIDQNKLPAINIIGLSEPSTSHNDAPAIDKRIYQVVLQVYAKSTDGSTVEDDLDEIADVLELELQRDPTFGQLVNNVRVAGTEFGADEELSAVIGVLRIAFDVVYYKKAINFLATDLFDTVKVDIEEKETGFDLSEQTIEDINQE